VRLRPPILFTAIYGAGLATGLLHFGAPAGVGAAICLLVILVRHSLVTLLAAAALLGRLGAEIGWLREAASCATRLPAARMRLTVRLLEPADSSDARIAVQPLRAGCIQPVMARWRVHRSLPAGVVVDAIAQWIPRSDRASRPSGTLVVREVRQVSGTPDLTSRVKSAIAHASRVLYGTRAPMVDALIVGRRGGISRDLQDRFAQSGLVHLLSISGFHVGVITGWIVLLGRVLGMGRTRALTLAAIASMAYVSFLGWPAPATRAAALAVVVAWTRARQRKVDSDALLSATCLCVLLIDPWSVLDLGAWLSAAALWGATRFSRWTDGALGPTPWWRTLGSSVGATLATAPITAFALGTVAMIGVVLNFVAIPLAAIAVPGVLASLLVFPVWRGLAEAFAAGSGLLLHLLELLAVAGGAVPGGHLVTPPELRSGLPWLGALGLSLWAIGQRNTLAEALRRWSWVGVAALWSGLLGTLLPRSTDHGFGLALHFLDVGQGDGAVLRTPGGRWVLIDAGPRTEQADAGRHTVIPYLASQGVRGLAVAIVSHAHADHLGGIPSVLQRFPAAMVIEPGDQVADPLYYEFLGELAADSIPWHPGRRGERFVLDSVRFTILHPCEWARWGEDLNEDSVVLLLEFRDFQAILTGDAGFPAEAAMRSESRAIDLLKVGHHGSRWSTGDEWLDSLRPRAAVISVGSNTYGHPSPETLGRLARHHVEVWRTDRDGMVTVTTDGRGMTVEAGGHTATYDVRDTGPNRR
jgi:competence protein ComEC